MVHALKITLIWVNIYTYIIMILFLLHKIWSIHTFISRIWLQFCVYPCQTLILNLPPLKLFLHMVTFIIITWVLIKLFTWYEFWHQSLIEMLHSPCFYLFLNLIHSNWEKCLKNSTIFLFYFSTVISDICFI